MLRNIFIALLVVVVAAVGYGFTLPDKTHVERSTVIGAPPAKVFAVVNDLKSFNKFSPWYGLQPDAAYSYEGPPSGVGQKMTWHGDKVGDGSQTIIESQADRLVKTSLDFGFGAPTASFVLAPQADGTKVTWSYDESHDWNIVGRYFGSFMAEPEVGSMYEKGLVSLKGYVESMPGTTTAQSPQATGQASVTSTAAAATNTGPFRVLVASNMKAGDPPAVVTLEARPVAMMRVTASTKKPEETSAALGEAYGKITDFIQDQELSVDGAPLALTVSYDDKTGQWVFDAALPVSEIPAGTPTEAKGVKTGMTPAGKAVMVVHKGPYSSVSPEYDKIMAYMKANNLQGGTAIEEYANDPSEVEEADLITNIYFLTK